MANQISEMLGHWPVDRLKALYRARKRTGFFKNARRCVELRELIETKEKENANLEVRSG